MNASHGGQGAAAPTGKAALRAQVLAARRDVAPTDADAIAAHVLAWEVVRRSDTVAAYVSFGREPGTRPLLDGLVAADKRVLLPVLMTDNDLDWALYSGSDDLASGVGGLQEPVGARLGVDAIRTADVVLAPGLAVSRAGTRLGRGGGSYDRALARVAPGTPIAVVLLDSEVGLDVPREPHDRPVTHALTPNGVTPLG